MIAARGSELYSISYRVQGAILIAVLLVFLVAETLVTNANARQTERSTGASTTEAPVESLPYDGLTDDMLHPDT